MNAARSAGRSTGMADAVVVNASEEPDVAARLAAASDAGATVFVLVSSARVYGADPRHDMLMTEAQPLAECFDDPTLAAIADADRFCCEAAESAAGSSDGDPMRIVVLRPVHVLGSSAPEPLAEYLAAGRVRGRFGFDPFMLLMHADDLERAVECAIDPPGGGEPVSGPWNVTGAGGLPLSRLVREAGGSRVTGPTGVLIDLVEGLGIDLTTRMNDTELRYVLSVDGSAFAEATGYEPVRSLAETVAAAARNEGASA